MQIRREIRRNSMLREIINRNPVCVTSDMTARDMADLMEIHNVGSVIVLQEGKPVGIVTDRDLVIRCLSKNRDSNLCTASDIMTRAPRTMKETDGLYDCIRVMREAQIRRMPIVDEEGTITGIITFDDILSMLTKELADLTTSSMQVPDEERIAA